ncbi:acetoin utilization protein AcuC [Macrococcus equipercicus]|uniref:Acetoin utilization protein AcuC n=1 Tax=Macrococcus equipercicus TaxID=69967 RepID=A0A9Q9F0Q0_9STAP|nr:acetoin utilization protein AcuC [Macrococcus equipercicus]KAA1038415.1 acetoin utilization protein AcuC [Macrococcus equipercicus]UTH13198.1 acetoin utilization protein AcuC [Macrococcus equipercicus]
MSKYIYSEELLNYRFSDSHPFNQMRLVLTTELLQALEFLDDSEMVPARKATDDELKLVHTADYVEAVKQAGLGTLSQAKCDSYGLNTNDTPNFSGMHDSSAWLVGGTLTACDIVMTGADTTACNLGGGLHHGFRGRASGFCIYNDSAVAIEYMKQKYGARVLYIDTDAHHGDGVQWAFYNDDDAFTYSIHETGRYLFPGTGGINEKGEGDGYLYSMNLPIDAYTEDDSFLECFKESVEVACRFFKPDVIISQNGADAHYLDPLTHLHCTHHVFEAIPRIVKQLADDYCGGKWIAVGGGGYNIFQVAPLAWSQIWLAMKGIPAPSGNLPKSWLEKWQKKTEVTLPAKWDADSENYTVIPRRVEITEKNRRTLERVIQHYE